MKHPDDRLREAFEGDPEMLAYLMDVRNALHAANLYAHNWSEVNAPGRRQVLIRALRKLGFSPDSGILDLDDGRDHKSDQRMFGDNARQHTEEVTTGHWEEIPDPEGGDY